jgi:hypothetical protein
MTLNGIRPDDIVHCDVRGERFYATVTDPPHRGEVAVATMCRERARIVTARQVIGHWRKRRTRS